MSNSGIDPNLTLAIVLGASEFPRAPNLTSGPFFTNSAADFRAYLTNQGGLGLQRSNVLNLFNDSRSSSEMLEEIARFLLVAQSSATDGAKPSDLIIYYVGHGGFSRDGQNYFLAVKATNQTAEVASSIRISDLAGVILDNARFMRRYIILDCCFAAEAYRAFQSAPGQLACSLVLDKIPGRGTALLCASGRNRPAIAPSGERHTMFSTALLDSLRSGHDSFGPLFSIEELADLIRTHLRSRYPQQWVRPEVHAPNQEEGNLARLPIFPNRSHRLGGPSVSLSNPDLTRRTEEVLAEQFVTESLEAASAERNIIEQLRKQNTEELYRNAREKVHNGQWSAARQFLILIQERDPNYRDTMSLLLNVRQHENVAKLWIEAESAMESKRWKAALLALNTLVCIDVNGRTRAQNLLREVLKHLS